MSYVAAKNFTLYGKRYREGQEFDTSRYREDVVEGLKRNGRIVEGQAEEAQPQTQQPATSTRTRVPARTNNEEQADQAEQKES